mmetsp:Transcript_49240/g.116357  ORF Transcript_49240/g.116357 Transcript_49240/m.116357 type:complete len:91 (+) Transcript_49240:55-327(+)
MFAILAMLLSVRGDDLDKGVTTAADEPNAMDRWWLDDANSGMRISPSGACAAFGVKDSAYGSRFLVDYGERGCKRYAGILPKAKAAANKV